MNKYEVDPDQWQRLQVKSKDAWGAKWRFLKIAKRRGLSADAIESLVDETIKFKEAISEYRSKISSGNREDSNEIRQGKTQHESTSDGGATRSSEST